MLLICEIFKPTKINRIRKSAKSQKWIGFTNRKSAKSHICGREGSHAGCVSSRLFGTNSNKEAALQRVHCNENPIYVFIFWELRGFSPNFHIHLSVSDLYIPRIGPHIFLQQNGQTDPGNI